MPGNNIQKMIETCQELMNVTNDLTVENKFLTDCIVNSKTGAYVNERRAMLQDISRREAVLKENQEQLEKQKKALIKEEKLYRQHQAEIEEKEKDFDNYVQSMAGGIIKNKLAEKEKEFQSSLEKQQAEYEAMLKQKEKAAEELKRETKILMVVCILAIVGAVGMAVLHFCL